MIFLLNQKLFYYSSYFYTFEFYFFNCVITDLGVFSLFYYLPLGSTVLNTNYIYYKLKRIAAMIGVLLLMSVHGYVFYHAFFTDKHPYLWFCVRCLFWELAVALTVGIIGAICYLSHKLYKKI
jgi:hypothetical protein